MRQPPSTRLLRPTPGKILLDLEIRERVAALEKTVQRIPQAGKVPTAARQRIDDLSLGFQRRHLKRPVKGPIRHPDPQIRIEHQ